MALTYEQVKEKALTFKTRGAFRKAFGGYVAWANKHGVYDELTQHMCNGRYKWDLVKVQLEASKYPNRRAFQDGSKGAYLHALANGHLDTVCRHMKPLKNTWCYDTCVIAALKYTMKEDFYKGDKGAYDHARRNGFFEDITAHMKVMQHTYTDKELSCIAKQYSYRSAFVTGDYNAYHQALRRKLLPSITSHMLYKDSQTDNDCVYVWELVGERWNDKQLYKIGLTSQRLGDARIKICAASGGFEYRVITLTKVNNALAYEQKALKIGDNPRLKGFEGASEVRALSKKELKQVLEIIML